MKFIIYHLDSLTNLALKGKNNNYFKKKKLNSNFISKTKNKSIFFENSYGYGETWSTTFE